MVDDLKLCKSGETHTHTHTENQKIQNYKTFKIQKTEKLEHKLESPLELHLKN